MSAEHRNLTWILLLLFLAGVLCNTWNVEYKQQHICAVKGSSAVVSCSFYSPEGKSVKRVMWGHGKSQRFISSSNPRKATSRFQYIGDRLQNCSLKIHQVEHNDAGNYTVRFFTAFDAIKGIRPRKRSPTLKVVDLNISVSKPEDNTTTKEGDSVSLSCINGCDGGHSSSAFTWFRNGELLNEGPVLYLSNMSITTSGNYTCSLKTQPGTSSRVVHFDVEHSPKNTSVSVRPSLEVDPGSNFTLICGSHANPPVENYTWFKKDDDNNDVAVGHQPVFSSGDGGRYFCSAANKHGSQNSSAVTVKIKAWATFTRDVLIIAAAVVFLIATSVIAIKRLHKKRTWAPRMDCEDEAQDADYVNWFNTQSNEGHQREEVTELVYATVYFNNRESSMEQQTGCYDDDQSVIYSTVCR